MQLNKRGDLKINIYLKLFSEHVFKLNKAQFLLPRS